MCIFNTIKKYITIKKKEKIYHINLKDLSKYKKFQHMV